MDAEKTEAPPNPFAGEGGSFYLDPNGSNVIERDRNEPTPFDALTKLEKYARLDDIPKALISDRDREARIGAIGLTADDYAQLAPIFNSPTPTPAPTPASAELAPSTPVASTKIKGSK